MKQLRCPGILAHVVGVMFHAIVLLPTDANPTYCIHNRGRGGVLVVIDTQALYVCAARRQIILVSINEKQTAYKRPSLVHETLRSISYMQDARFRAGPAPIADGPNQENKREKNETRRMY